LAHREIAREAAALLAFMARRGVVVFEDGNGGYRLGVFNTAGPALAALPGPLGRIGLQPLDLPRPPAPRTVLAMLRAGLLASTMGDDRSGTVVHLVTAEGMRCGLQERKQHLEGVHIPAPGAAPVIELDVARALRDRRSLVQSQRLRLHE